MYSQQELDDAVAAGAITAAAADALRAHVENQRHTVIPDEEQFRLLTGFNDIFVSIAAVILLVAVTKDLTATVKAGDLVKDAAGLVGGRGGGKPDLAQAGGPDPAGLAKALARVEELVRAKVG
jgi:alanyl-tRNA synthetase